MSGLIENINSQLFRKSSRSSGFPEKSLGSAIFKSFVVLVVAVLLATTPSTARVIKSWTSAEDSCTTFVMDWTGCCEPEACGWVDDISVSSLSRGVSIWMGDGLLLRLLTVWLLLVSSSPRGSNSSALGSPNGELGAVLLTSGS